MPEMTVFEARLAAALQARADAIDDGVDAVAVAARVATRRPRGRGWPALGGPVIGGSASRRWIVLVTALLTLALGLALIGAPLVMQPEPPPVHGPVIIDVVSAAPGQLGVVAGSDGLLWRLELGRLTRIDPASGAARTWDVADDARFFATALAPSRRGGVWLAHGSRIVRFDGTSFRDTLPEVPGEPILALVEAADGTIWVGNEGAIRRLDGDAWTAFELSRPTMAPLMLVVDTAGRPWVNAALFPGPHVYEIAHLDGGRWTTYHPVDIAGFGTTVNSIAAARDGGVVIGTNRGIARFNGAWASLPAPTPASGSGADGWLVAEAAGGQIWAAMTTETGYTIARMDQAGWQAFVAADGLPEIGAYADVRLVETSTSMLATIDGTPYRFAEGRWQPLGGGLPSGVPGFDMPMVAVSGDEAWLIDDLWTDNVNADRLWHLVGGEANPVPGSALGSRPSDIALLAGRPIVAATRGVQIWTDSGWDRIDPRPAIALTVASDGRVWVVGDAGVPTRILTREGDGWRSTELPEPPLRGQILVDQHGDAWMIGPSRSWPVGGMARFDGSDWESVAVLPQDPPNSDTDLAYGDIALAPNGDIWVTIVGAWTSGGCCSIVPERQIARFDGTTWTFFGGADGLPSAGVAALRHIAVTPDGRVWASGMDLLGFDGTRWTPYLPGTIPGTLAVAPNGDLWASGQIGVLRIALPKP